MPSYDSTTPSQYNANNSGLLYYIEDSKGATESAVITQGAREKYNNLIDSYGLQFYEAEKVRLYKDIGLSRFNDMYGNELYKITPQHLAFFMKLNRWRKELRADDTLWMKMKLKNIGQ